MNEPARSHKVARGAESNSVREPEKVQPLFQDNALLKRFGIDPLRSDHVLLRCVAPLELLVGKNAVNRNLSRVVMPHRRSHTGYARVFLRQALGVDLSGQKQIENIPGVTAGNMEELIEKKYPDLKVPSFSIYATDSISIFRDGLDKFVLLLKYPNEIYGAIAQKCFQDLVTEAGNTEDSQYEASMVNMSQPAAASSSSSSSSSMSRPTAVSRTSVVAAMFASERYICGVIRRWPGILAPSEAEIRSQLDTIGAKNVLCLLSSWNALSVVN